MIFYASEIRPENIRPPRRRGTVRVELSSDPVKLRGETLSQIWWRGKQWAVTSYGIERLDGTYFLEAKRLLERLHDYPWPLQMAAKGRVDAEEFTTAWMFAILLHGQGRRVDAKAIYETIAKLPPIAETS